VLIDIDQNCFCFAGYLKQCKVKNFQQQLRIVRVYSKTIERDVFPVPRDLTLTKKQNKSDDNTEQRRSLQAVSLHYLIRTGEGELAKQICAMDERIQCDRDGTKISDSEIKKYLVDISKAEHDILQKADVILCTCTVSASKRITAATNILQVCNS